MKLDMASQADPNEAVVHETMALYGLAVRSWEICAEGIGNVVIRANTTDGQTYYAKYYNTDHSADHVHDEVEFTNRLAEAGVPVPRYVRCKDSSFVTTRPHPKGENAITITRQLEGAHPANYTAQLLGELARQHARMHQEASRWPGEREFDPINNYHYYEPRPQETDLKALAAQMQPIIERVQAGWSVLPRGMAHLDLTRSNILTIGDRLTGIIDFEDVSVAPFAFCLAGTLWDIYATGGNRQNVAYYLAEYQRQRPLVPAELVALPDMVAFRGWIALHGNLLTQGPGSEESLKQTKLLNELVENKILVS